MSQEEALIYAKTSLFIGLTTLPVEGDSYTFYEENIEENFIRYKKDILYYDKNSPEKERADFCTLYTPNAYYLFGEFDLAVISLIDDFSFATKKFRPTKDKTFKYQVNTGLIPIMKDPQKNVPFDTVEQYNNKIFKENQKLPIIGITSIKLNSCLVVGNGRDFTNAMCFYLKHFLDDLKRKQAGEHPGLVYEFLIIESLGWNEITLVAFSNAFEAIHDAIGELRNTNWGDVKNFLQSKAVPVTFIDDSSLLQKWIMESNGEPGNKQPGAGEGINAAHPIIATNTQLGFHLDYKRPGAKSQCMDILDEEFTLSGKNDPAAYFQVNWNVKAGHDLEFIKTVEEHFKFEAEINIAQSAGKNSFSYPSAPISFKAYFEHIHKPLIGTNAATKAIARHVYKMETSIIAITRTANFKDKLEKQQRNKQFDAHFEISEKLSKLCFHWEEDIKRLERSLRKLTISKILKGQVINMFHNFNEAIKDQLIFNNFIDLKGALNLFKETYLNEPTGNDETATPDVWKENERTESAKEPTGYNETKRQRFTISNKSPDKPDSLTHEIKTFVEAWDIAFWNRYFHSYYFTEVSDFNLEHHGGIEMILCAYDSMYKIINNAIYKDRTPYEEFVRVTIEPSITSNRYSNQLNFIHLFMPSLYATTVVHEAANHYIFEIPEQGGADKEMAAFIRSLSGVKMNRKNPYYDLFEQLRSAYNYNSATEKKLLDEYVGDNLLRYLVTDFLTYKIQFEEDDTATGVDKFMGFHLGVIAQQTELYQYDAKKEYWEFDEYQFKSFYLRMVLMFKVFGIPYEQKSYSPFTVFQSLYNNHAHDICKNADKLKDSLNVFFKQLRPFLEAEVEKMISGGDRYFKQIIGTNRDFLEKFYSAFSITTKTGPYKTNVLLRKTQATEPGVPEPKGSAEPESNIALKIKEDTITYSDLLLDPKGGSFCIAISKRGDMHALNCKYLKDTWDIAQKWRINLYEKK